jgi:hypothetical protein
MGVMRSQLAARWARVPASIRKPVVTAVGVVLILVGAVAVVLPGPWTIPPILAGLAVLATEYHWARAAQEAIKAKVKLAADRVRRR